MRKTCSAFFLLLVMAAFFSIAVTSAAAAPSDAANFYKGKTVTLHNTGNPGSSSDVWTRVLARHLEKEIGATVVVKNESGGNGKVLFNQFAKTIKGDGLNVCVSQGGTLTPPYMTGDKAVQYEIAKFKYLGGVENANMILSVAFNGNIKTIDDLKKTKNLKFSHQAKTSLPTLANALAIDFLGLDGKLILGFEGSPAKQLAVQQGECQGTVSPGDSAMLAEQKKAMKAILQIGKERTSPGENLPLFLDYVNVNNLTAAQKRLLDSMDMIDDAKLFLVPPDTPQDKIDFLSIAFKNTYDTPAMKGEIEKIYGFKPGTYISAKDITKRMTETSNKKTDVALWNDLLDKYTK
jgi:tripartite-type tricarboxylate transporter receptor subunit TctC